MADASRPFDRAGLEAAFGALGEAARCEGRIVEIAVYGGAAMVFTFDARPSTKDVDAMFENNRAWVRVTAGRIGEGFGWQDGWINDGVKGFLSASDAAPSSKRLLRGYPDEREPGLRVMIAQPEYLFAMKAIAMRIGGQGGPDDVADLRLLASELGIASAEAALTVVDRYYPAQRVHHRLALVWKQFSVREQAGHRPRALAEVARRARASPDSYGPALREFLDSFYLNASDRVAAITEAPLEVGEIEDAYLAATAEHLALVYDLPVPAWTEAPGRSLKRPFFAGGEALMAILLAESPTAFRRRQIFISANSLDRPRMFADV